MKTIVSSLLFLGILASSAGSLVQAADRQPLLRKGKVLILKNEYTTEGDIERIDDRYCVRRGLAETWVPAERVLALVASLPDAYAYLRGRINIDDPDERLRLARWCRTNGLQQQALVELRAAAELRPSHVETRRLLRYWQQEAASGAASAARAAAAPRSADATPLAAEAPPIEVTTESLGLFATRVQPILMNTCARCHATGRGGKFHLAQIFEDTLSNRRTLERNLAAVLAQIDVNQPDASRLLIKSVSDHAHTGQAPLRDRQATPYRTLENWVKLTVADNPHLRDKSVLTQSVGTRESTESVATRGGMQNVATREPAPEMLTSRYGEPPAKAGEESQWGAEARPAAPITSSVARGDKGKAAPQPSGTAVSPVDPYDPEPFNRKLHPEANK